MAFFKINKFCAHCIIFIIQGLRPLLGPENICPYKIGCTQYAIKVLNEQNLLYALWLIAKRLLSCHPFKKSYED